MKNTWKVTKLCNNALFNDKLKRLHNEKEQQKFKYVAFFHT